MVNARLHPRTIEAVKERADIVDVVGEHVVLKKKGREFVGICPFHDDSKPSMTVSPAKQFYYCFSCGAGGNSIKFLMEFQRQSFSDVVLDLARRYQLPIETVDGPQQERLRQQLSRRDKLQRALALASGWFRSQLRSPAGQEALNYLTEQRGLSPAVQDAFELGYAPDQWDGLLKHLQQVEGLAPELLESAGLVVPRKGGNGFYDRFRHRVIVPIHDRQGRVIGFGGRSLDGSEPKYLNSPETEVFEKGKHLFGLDKASNAIRKDDRAVVVEGYFDVIALTLPESPMRWRLSGRPSAVNKSPSCVALPTASASCSISMLMVLGFVRRIERSVRWSNSRFRANWSCGFFTCPRVRILMSSSKTTALAITGRCWIRHRSGSTGRSSRPWLIAI
jgi:DNA primase